MISCLRANVGLQIDKKLLLLMLLFTAMVLYSNGALADDPDPNSIGGIAASITGSFENVAKLIVAMSYIGGIGFAAAGILKFKQHKDNPTQVTLGAPLALIFIAAALIWLPGIIKSTGGTVFGESSEDTHGSAAGADIFGDG